MERPGDREAEPGREPARHGHHGRATAPTSRARRSSSPQFLADYSPEWKSGPGVDKTVKWPTGTGAKGNDGVAGCVKQTDGAVGYVEQAYALQNNFTSADVKNKAGKFVAPTLESTSAAGEGVEVPDDLRFSDHQRAGPEGLPDHRRRRSCSSTRTCARRASERDTAKLVKSWLDYALGDGPERRAGAAVRAAARRDQAARRRPRSTPCSATATADRV